MCRKFFSSAVVKSRLDIVDGRYRSHNYSPFLGTLLKAIPLPSTGSEAFYLRLSCTLY